MLFRDVQVKAVGGMRRAWSQPDAAQPTADQQGDTFRHTRQVLPRTDPSAKVFVTFRVGEAKITHGKRPQSCWHAFCDWIHVIPPHPSQEFSV